VRAWARDIAPMQIPNHRVKRKSGKFALRVIADNSL
jgi:hypothetical protein